MAFCLCIQLPLIFQIKIMLTHTHTSILTAEIVWKWSCSFSLMDETPRLLLFLFYFISQSLCSRFRESGSRASSFWGNRFGRTSAWVSVKVDLTLVETGGIWYMLSLLSLFFSPLLSQFSPFCGFRNHLPSCPHAILHYNLTHIFVQVQN